MAAVIPQEGYQSYCQFDIQSVYGTPVAAAKKIYINKWELGIEQEAIKSGALTGSRQLTYVAPGKQLIPVSFDLEWLYTGDERLAKWGLGKNVTTGASPYDHVATDDPAAGVLPLAGTFEFIDGLATPKATRITDMICRSMSWEAKGPGPVLCHVEALAPTITFDFTLTPALTFPTFAPVLGGQATTLTDGSAVAIANNRVKSFKYNFTQPLDDARDYLGSFAVDIPLPNGPIGVTANIEQEYISSALGTAVKTNSNVAFKITFTSGANTVSLEVPNSLPSSYKDTVDGFGVGKSKADYESYGNLTFQPKMTHHNVTATI